VVLCKRESSAIRPAPGGCSELGGSRRDSLLSRRCVTADTVRRLLVHNFASGSAIHGAATAWVAAAAA